MRFLRASAAIFLVNAPLVSLAGLAWGADPEVLPAPRFAPGDTWVVDRSVETGKDGFSHLRLVGRIDRVGSDSLVMGVKLDGAPGDFEDHLMGLDLSDRRMVDGQSVTTGRPLAFPLKVGETWQEDFVDPRRQGAQTSAHITRTCKVVGWEDVVVPAGTFHALKIESNGQLTAQLSLPATAVSASAASPAGGTSFANAQPARSVTVTGLNYRAVYYVPAVKSWVKMVTEQYNSENVRTRRETSVLVSFTPAR
jgi:hypothetical protein